ncbi:hypothetical protein [Shouchella miscanthi]|uniref:hypothetical protein n=1 Tax=Shouchella miscanthi TaxID=2598861 RepID=UPI0011A0A97C|nr:hypothetical protein [Shouchella miscanthi]
MTVRELFNEAALEQYEELMKCIQVLIYKKAVDWSDSADKLDSLIDPKYKRRFYEVAKEMGVTF